MQFKKEKYCQIFFTFILVFTMLSCGETTKRPDSEPARKNFNIKSLAKSNIDDVLDIHVNEMLNFLRELTIKLYKRNPRELQKNELKTIQENLVKIFELNHHWTYPELDRKKGAAAIQLTFENDYKGDRVFSFIVGLTSMVMASYEYKTDFYLLDEVDPQKLYNCARNLEIAMWKLTNNMDSHHELFLFSNSLPGEDTNLSYERLFGKMIATQDNMAIIIAGKTNRIVKTVIQKMATAVFLPI